MAPQKSATLLISTAEVAKRLGIARSTVLQRIGTGRLEPVSQLSGVTGAYLFDAEQIDRLAAEAQR